MKILIDKNAKTTPTDFSWQFGMGNDHAALTLRTDMCEHLKLAHYELGLKFVRFHGIFDDDLYVYQALADNRYMRGLWKSHKVGTVNFHHVGVVFDNVLKCGLKPFVELSFMPKRLASGKKVGFKYFHYENNITMPKSLERWQSFVKEFIQFLLDRYGRDEVESWYFEVWNEPDLACFFKGKQKDYFKLYKATVSAVKSVDENLRVGGPSTSACRWIDDFVAFCEKENVPFDFVSTHHYPGDGFGNTFTAKDAFKMMGNSGRAANEGWTMGKTFQTLYFKPSVSKNWNKSILRKFDESVATKTHGKPLFISEWNSMAVFGAPVHDEKYSAAFVIKTAIDFNNLAQGQMFWCVSDLFEEQMMIGEPFHGSYGIVNNCGIPKPNFWAFKMLSMLCPNRLELATADEKVDVAAYTDGQKLQVLVTPQSPNCELHEQHEVEIVVNGKYRRVMASVIDDTHANPKQLWLDLGSPQHLTPQQVEEIKTKSALTSEPIDFDTDGETTTVKLNLSTNDVVMLSFYPNDSLIEEVLRTAK